MKKIFCIMLSVTLFFGFTSFAEAATPQTDIEETTEVLEDGSYFETTISSNEGNSLLRAARSGSKTVTYKSSSGATLWSVTVNGTFSYSGSSATCSSSTVSASSSSSSWKVSNKSASKSGNKANATATGTQYNGSTAIGSITRTVTLTCSASGSLS